MQIYTGFPPISNFVWYVRNAWFLLSKNNCLNRANFPLPQFRNTVNVLLLRGHNERSWPRVMAETARRHLLYQQADGSTWSWSYEKSMYSRNIFSAQEKNKTKTALFPSSTTFFPHFDNSAFSRKGFKVAHRAIKTFVAVIMLAQSIKMNVGDPPPPPPRLSTQMFLSVLSNVSIDHVLCQRYRCQQCFVLLCASLSNCVASPTGCGSYLSRTGLSFEEGPASA